MKRWHQIGARIAQRLGTERLTCSVRIAAPTILVLGFLALAILTKKTSAPPIARPREAPALTVYQRVCQACHGAAGEGKIALKTPSIAGQPAWYLARQLEQFQKGLQMRHLLSYLSASDALDVSAYIATLAARYPP